MSELSKAQRIRLGVFLLAALALAVIAILAKVGSEIFETPDRYIVRVPDGVGGLVPGADVTYNGIVVGKVGSVAVDPSDVSVVRLELELDEGTPVPEDATAAVELVGITGMRRVNLSGGTNNARLRRPGEEIPAGRGLFDELIEKAESISAKIDTLAEQMTRLTGEQNLAHIERTLANVERASDSVAGLLEETRPRVSALLSTAEETGDEIALTLRDVRHTVGTLDKAIVNTERAVLREVGPLARDAREVMGRVDEVVARFDVAVSRTQADVQRVLVELADGIDSITELADMLRRDPSSLINGKSWAGR